MWTVDLTINLRFQVLSGVFWTGPNVALFQFTVDCDDIVIIGNCLIAIVVLNAIGAVLALSGSVIGCIGTCCAQQNVSRHEISM